MDVATGGGNGPGNASWQAGAEASELSILSPEFLLTTRQAEHFPYLARNGGIVVGDKGRDIGLLNRDPFAPLNVQRVNGPTLPQTWWPQ